MAFYVYDVLQSIAIIIPLDAKIIPSNWPHCPLDMISLVFNRFLANTISYPRLILYYACRIWNQPLLQGSKVGNRSRPHV